MNGFAFLILLFLSFSKFFVVVLFLWSFLFLWFYDSKMRIRSFGACHSLFDIKYLIYYYLNTLWYYNLLNDHIGKGQVNLRLAT